MRTCTKRKRSWTWALLRFLILLKDETRRRATKKKTGNSTEWPMAARAVRVSVWDSDFQLHTGWQQLLSCLNHFEHFHLQFQIFIPSFLPHLALWLMLSESATVSLWVRVPSACVSSTGSIAAAGDWISKYAFSSRGDARLLILLQTSRWRSCSVTQLWKLTFCGSFHMKFCLTVRSVLFKKCSCEVYISIEIPLFAFVCQPANYWLYSIMTHNRKAVSF